MIYLPSVLLVGRVCLCGCGGVAILWMVSQCFVWCALVCGFGLFLVAGSLDLYFC